MYQDTRGALRRLTGTVVATTALALATTTLAAPAQAADRDRDRTRATGWLVTQLDNGHFYNDQFDYVDWGLTVDGLFALAADSDRAQASGRVGRAVRNHVDDYTVYNGDRSAGATGKTLVAAEVLDANSRSFGGHNLRGELRRLIDSGGADEGRLEDSGSTDYSNTITQAYGVIGLARSGGAPRSTVKFLLRQRCKGGYFRLDMTRRGSCKSNGGAANVDATSLAIQAMVAADRNGTGLRDGLITRSGKWLAKAQRRNGSFRSSADIARSNTNSTGLAVQALALTLHGKAVRKAARWVASLQITRRRVDGGPARRDIGAIAYDREGLRQALDEGITPSTRDQFRRATTQAVFALKPAPLSRLVRR